MAQNISLPVNYSRLYPAWTIADHNLFRELYSKTGSQLDAFKRLLDSKGISYDHIID